MPAAILGVPRAVPSIGLGVGDSRDAAGLGQWQPDAGNVADSRWNVAPATWNGEEPFFVDVTCYGIEIDTYTGRERAAVQWEVGTATIVLDNNSGWADYPPTMEPNPYDLTVRPGRQVRVAMSVDGGEPRVLWRGWVDAVNPGFDAEYGDTVTLECIDAKGEVGRVDVAAVDPAVGAGESIKARLNRIATAAGWGPYYRNFDDAGINVVATELGGQAADLLNRAADSGGGALFGDVDGKLRYRNRDWQLWPADELEDGIIGNVRPATFVELALVEPAGDGLYDPEPALDLVEDPAGDGLYTHFDPYTTLEGPPGLHRIGTAVPGDTCPTAWEMSFARAEIATRVLVGRPDMNMPIVVVDDVAEDYYGVETIDITDLETSLNAEMTQIANRLLVTHGATTMPRIAAVTLNAAATPTAVDVLSTADPRTPSRFRCRHVSQGRQVFERFMFCTGIRHTIGPDVWEARLSLDDAMPWQITAANAFWQETEVVDAGHWQQSKWGADITPAGRI